MMSLDLAMLDATAQAELVRTRQATPGELVDAAIERLERVNPLINAVIFPALEAARDRARSPALTEGPFPGVPILMKDLGGNEAGRPYCGGMRCLREAGWTDDRDSYFTEKLLAAGCVSLGRTNTPELGLLPTTEPAAFGPTRNPWNLAYSAGGSSGGSAAAVAAGIVPVAHASDGGGSIRIPASMCGLVGLKPTRGRNSFGPALGERWSGCSSEFVLARSVRDAAEFLDVTSGAMPGDPYSAPPPSLPFADALAIPPPHLRIAVMRRGPRDVALDPECLAAVDAAARLVADLGHRVEEGHPAALDDPNGIVALLKLVAAHTAHNLDTWAARLGRPLAAGDVEPLTLAVAERGRELTATAVLEAIDGMHVYGRALAGWWHDGFDLLLTPTMAAPPPPLGFVSSTADEPFRAFMRAAPYSAYTSPFNLSGQPAISLPLHWSADGLPIGVQLVAAYGREDLLLQVAAQLEHAAPWASRRPPVHASTPEGC